MMRILLTVLALAASATAVWADECRDNGFSPTFVRFNNLPGVPVHYVETNGTFTPMPDPPTAQATCTARGVRQLITGQDCRQRPWGHFGCGCNIVPSPNSTCARFHSLLSSGFGIDPRGSVMLSAGMQNNVNLPGMDIGSVPALTPLMCRQACQRDGRCASWTWVRPSVCWLKNSVPQAVPNTCCVSAVERAAAPPITLSAGMADNVNLPGGDYRSAASSGPQACRSSCQGDNQCVAWTWVKPQQSGGAGICYFKNRVTQQVANNCCVSAVERTAGPSVTLGSGMANNVNLPGGDIGQFAAGQPQACRDACQRNGSCRSWTWVKPQQVNANGTCFLKNVVPRQVANNCCVSAIERTATVATISVIAATYGGNCGTARGNVTGHIANACNGKAACNYAVDHRVIGDPKYGCRKDYVVQYSCGGQQRQASAGAEAGYGSVVTLSCQ